MSNEAVNEIENFEEESSQPPKGFLTSLFTKLKPQPKPKRLKFNTRELNRFMSTAARVKESPLYNPLIDDSAPYGYYDGRHLIGDTNPIVGGIYLGLIPHEALVVDEKYGLLAKHLQQFIMGISQHDQNLDALESRVFHQVVRFTKERLLLNEERVRELAFDKNIGPDRKIALDFYLKEKVGAARHQVLFAVYLLQKLIERSLISGATQIDREHGDLPAEDERLFYHASDGKILIFDPKD